MTFSMARANPRSSRRAGSPCSPLHLRSKQQEQEEGAAPIAVLLPASQGGMDTACKSCCGTVVVYQAKACTVVFDAKVTPRSCGPSSS